MTKMRKLTYLPLVHFFLLPLVLLEQIIEHLLEALGVGFQGWDDVLDCALDEHAVDHAETLAVAGKWGERLED